MKRIVTAALIVALTNPASAASYGTPDFLSLSLNGTTATGFGTTIGTVPQWINFGGSGLPGLNLSSRTVLARASTGNADFADLQINRVTTFSAGTPSNINAALRVVGVYGAGDATNEWNAAFTGNTNGAAGGFALGSFSQMIRNPGASDGIWGSISSGIDNNDNTSALSGSQVIGQEIDIAANKADNATNTYSFGNTGVRKGLNIVGIRWTQADTTQTEISHGIWFTVTNPSGSGIDAYTNFQSAIGFAKNTQIRNGLDTRGSITPAGSSNPVSAVTMDAGQVIDFNGPTTFTGIPRNYFAYDSVTSKLKYYVNGTAVMSVDNSGNARFLGTVTGSTTP